MCAEQNTSPILSSPLSAHHAAQSCARERESRGASRVVDSEGLLLGSGAACWIPPGRGRTEAARSRLPRRPAFGGRAHPGADARSQPRQLPRTDQGLAERIGAASWKESAGRSDGGVRRGFTGGGWCAGAGRPTVDPAREEAVEGEARPGAATDRPRPSGRSHAVGRGRCCRIQRSPPGKDDQSRPAGGGSCQGRSGRKEANTSPRTATPG